MLRPHTHMTNIFEINLEELKKNGKRVLIFDLDNTLIGDEIKEATKELQDWIKQVKKMEFTIYILSNNVQTRVEAFANQIDVPFIAHAKKPDAKGFLTIKELTKCEKEEMVMVGDRLFTDIAGGNKFGIMTILVDPIMKDATWRIRLIRRIEQRCKFLFN